MPQQTITKSIEVTTQGTIGAAKSFVVSAADWSRYLKLKAECSALEKQVKSLEQTFGFPTPDSLALDYGAVSGETLTFAVVNGNGDYMGKISVFYYPGADIPPSWRKRIS